MKKIKPLLILVFIVLTLFFLYNLYGAISTDRLILNIITSNEFSTQGTPQALVEVKDKKTRKSIKSTVSVKMYDSNKKKVKTNTDTYKIEEGEKARVSIDLPEDIDARKLHFRLYCKIWII